MATVTSLRNDRQPMVNNAVRHVQIALALTNGIAANGDDISVFGIPTKQKGRLIGASLRVSASLGAGATIQLRVGSTAVTAATTAAAAGKVTGDSNLALPLDIAGGEIVNLLVGGANITAAATATVDLYFANRE